MSRKADLVESLRDALERAEPQVDETETARDMVRARVDQAIPRTTDRVKDAVAAAEVKRRTEGATRSVGARAATAALPYNGGRFEIAGRDPRRPVPTATEQHRWIEVPGGPGAASSCAICGGTLVGPYRACPVCSPSHE